MPRKTKEQIEDAMESGDKEEDIYTEEGREVAEEEGTITDADEGFMDGYDEDERAVKCAKCGKILEEDYVEMELEGEDYKFCSEECAESFKKDQEE